MNEEKKESRLSKSKPLFAILFFVSLGGFSGSQVLYAIQALLKGFDLLWLIELFVFGFLLILSFVVLLAIIYVLDSSTGRVANRSAIIEGFLGDQNG
jgi:formate hydrogenlyase subunit 3/multisubunit Na+/H+ antiporter MnhD subunit